MPSDKRQNSLPSDLDLEELVGAAQEKPGEEPLVLNVSDVVRFMLLNKLMPGAHPIQSSLLYTLYQNWSQVSKSKGSFTQEIVKYLPHGTIQNQTVFYVNQDAFKLASAIQSLKDNTSTDKTKSKKWKKHFEAFLDHYKLSAGKTYMPYDAIWHLYDKWSHQISKKHPFGYTSLSQMCSLYFDKKRIGENRGGWFGVSENINEYITKQQLEELKHGQKRTRQKAIKATKKKKQSKS